MNKTEKYPAALFSILGRPGQLPGCDRARCPAKTRAAFPALPGTTLGWRSAGALLFEHLIKLVTARLVPPPLAGCSLRADLIGQGATLGLVALCLLQHVGSNPHSPHVLFSPCLSSHLPHRLETLKDRFPESEGWETTLGRLAKAQGGVLVRDPVHLLFDSHFSAGEREDLLDLPAKMLCEPQFLGLVSPRLQLCCVDNPL